MKSGQVPARYRFSRPLIRHGARVLMAAAVLVASPVGGVRASLEPGEPTAAPQPLKLWNLAQATAPPGDAVVPPVRREAPQAPRPPTGTAPAQPPAPPAASPAKTPEAAAQPATKYPPPPPEFSGIFGTIQEWLARANREYQGVVVKELSLPPPGAQTDDAIAAKLKEQQAEEQRQAAQAKTDAEAAAKAKAAEAKKLDEDRRRAEDTKRLADEAKKKADELLKSDAEKTPAPKPEVATPAAPPATKPQVATPAAPPAAKADDAAALAEKQRLETQKLEAQKREAQKLADEVKRQEQQRQAAEARRLEDERKKSEAAARAEQERLEAERRQQAEAQAAASAKHANRPVTITPEPIPRPVDPGTMHRPELASPASRQAARAAQAASERPPVESEPRQHRIRVFREATYRGTAVKRWVWRANGSACRAAGRTVKPPARYTIRRGDSLWRISERHYNEGRLYPKIFRANRSRIADPDLIYPCQRVLVPRK